MNHGPVQGIPAVDDWRAQAVYRGARCRMKTIGGGVWYPGADDYASERDREKEWAKWRLSSRLAELGLMVPWRYGTDDDDRWVRSAAARIKQILRARARRDRRYRERAAAAVDRAVEAALELLEEYPSATTVAEARALKEERR